MYIYVTTVEKAMSLKDRSMEGFGGMRRVGGNNVIITSKKTFSEISIFCLKDCLLSDSD